MAAAEYPSVSELTLYANTQAWQQAAVCCDSVKAVDRRAS